MQIVSDKFGFDESYFKVNVFTNIQTQTTLFTVPSGLTIKQNTGYKFGSGLHFFLFF